jgi:hypothetical protein
MKVLDTKYHCQLNNRVLPYVTCGTTSLANYINWLDNKWGTNFQCDDDKVMEILNSQSMLDKAKEMIREGIIDESALAVRNDNFGNPITIDGEHFTHLNNFDEMLAACGNFITNGQFNFNVEYRTPDEIKQIIDSDFPSLIAAMFTKSGHFVLVVGYDDEGNFIVDDPYGNWNDSYTTTRDGAKLKYNIQKVVSIYPFKKNGPTGDTLRVLRAYKV